MFGSWLWLLTIPQQSRKCQTFDFTALHISVAELASQFVPARVENAFQVLSDLSMAAKIMYLCIGGCL
jgi:hypothetical protein